MQYSSENLVLLAYSNVAANILCVLYLSVQNVGMFFFTEDGMVVPQPTLTLLRHVGPGSVPLQNKYVTTKGVIIF